MKNKLAFVSYETPFAPGGGIAAVMARLPGFVQIASGAETIVITPFHYRISKTAALRNFMEEAGDPIKVQDNAVRLLRYDEWSHIGKLNNPERLAGTLRDPDDPLAEYLSVSFNKDTQVRLQDYDASSKVTPELQAAIISELDRMLHDPSLFDEVRFPENKLGSEAIELAKKAPAGRELVRLNRFLLQRSYPEVISDVRNWPWFFLEALNNEVSEYFSGYPRPYHLADDQKENAAKLLKHSLLFGAAAARALDIINPEQEWVVLMQDWEASTAALALSDRASRHKLFLTLHNSYDAGVNEDDLSLIGIGPDSCPGFTALSRAIPLVQRPIFTVSEQFALDLTSDTFQVKVMADHLQELLKSDFKGINNGPFEALQMDQDVLQDLRRGSFAKLRKWKAANKRTALKALDNVEPSEDTPVWGDLKKFKRDEKDCWFVMAGRDDPRQKGYDVATAAIETFLAEGGEARFFFFPIPGDEDLRGLTFLKNLAGSRPESVLVFPFIWREGFFATLRGSAFGIMPSLYEPFGGANEFYLNGTMGIGRATGGLLQQIVPLWAVSSFSHAVQDRAQRWHTLSSSPTGLLFREKDDIATAVDDWKGINRARYQIGDSLNNRVEQRKKFATFTAIADELCLSIKDAVAIYKERPELYCRMIRDGVTHIQNSFSWERAAQEYVRYVL